MAQAIKRLYPETNHYRPSIKDGFYYDVDRETFTASEDLRRSRLR